MIEMSNYMREVLSQPDVWRRAAALAAVEARRLPTTGARVAFIGCGTSLFVAEAIATVRESRGLGESDAFSASELPTDRHYDLVVAISRSGTTTEVLDALRGFVDTPRLGITALEGGEFADLAGERIVLAWADERSVVQTRFATTVLALFYAHLGLDVEGSAKRAEEALEAPPPAHYDEVTQFVFLGRGAAVGLAHEAALKMRETLGAWTEAYPTREFRHGPISAVGPHSIVWLLDDEEPSIDAEIKATGAHVVRGVGDPLSELVRVHQVVAHLCDLRGVNPDTPRYLTRSIILTEQP